MIVVDDVTKRYGTERVLGPVSLTLGGEGVTAIIGPNGAGKSTLFGVIGRLVAPDAGSVTIDGAAVAAASKTRADAASLARTIALLRQDNQLTARLTVRDLVEFGRFPHSRGRLGPDDLAQIERAIAYLDLAGFEHRFLDELSGGQRQRAFIAMVLAQDTRYILLDEPLNSLDLAHSAEMMRLLGRLATELGKRIVVVLHDLNFAAAHADRIVAMRDGVVVADGPVGEVVTPEVLERVYGVPVGVRQIDGRPLALYYA